MNITQRFFINAGRITILNLAGIIIGGITSAAQLFDEKSPAQKDTSRKTTSQRHTFRSV
jgi:hypothetical protein